ncbi:MAG: BON domain-containing protein [bacterium]
MDQLEKDIKTKVENQIKWDNTLRASDIRVQVEGSRVRLEGKVPDYSSLRSAERDASLVRGVTGVENLLEVTNSSQIEHITDEEILMEIRNSLIFDKEIDSTGINVIVEEGVVILEGTVTNHTEKELAGKYALNTTGVLKVENNLSINMQGGINDEIIAEQVKEALDTNPYVDARDIEVVVSEGFVTLNGNVQDFVAANAARDAALYTYGVKGVSNNIIVG